MAKSILCGFALIAKSILQLIKIPLIGIGIGIGLFMFSCVYWYIYFVFIKKIKPIKSLNNRYVKKPGIIERVLVLASKQFVYDSITRPAYYFPKQGMIIFEGRQGNGKTSSMVHFLNEIKEQHPYAEILSNFAYIGENESLNHWKQLIDYQNHTDRQAGVVVAIDELQNWFSSKDSKNFDPQMLSVITQNRKNRRLILGTAQQFYMLSKDIRTQCTEVRHCTTFLGVITIVHRKEPIVDSEGQVEEWKNRGFYFWVHTQKDRESYDTWKCISNLKKAGFIKREE